MIGFIEGKILESTAERCVLTIQSQSGRVGYTVHHPSRNPYISSTQSAQLSGDLVSFWVYSNIREDAWDLYGFFSSREKELFRSLLNVTGVGPKLAMALMSGLPPEELVSAMVSKAIGRLTAISGVGKKTAERLTLELSELWSKNFSGPVGGAKTTGAASLPDDVKLALTGLGYRPQEIDQILQQMAVQWGSIEENAIPVRPEEWVRRALKVVRA